MDIHRSRFVPYPTSSISCLAFSRSSDSGFSSPLPSLKLAIGRANGNVEIWNPLKGSWVQEAVFVGDGKSVDGLAWTQDPNETDADGQIVLGQQRLFSISSSPSVTEWDLGTGKAKRQSSGNFSEVWCFAVQPRGKPSKSASEEPHAQEIVAGCGDGTLVLLSTADNDLQFKRNLARVSGKKVRCMCITYQKENVVVAGFADSMIRVYDTRNGSQLRTMSFGVGIPGAPKNILVWQVKCLPNGDIVSGDSNGEVRFWDGRNYTLLQRLKGHETDCLDIISSSDGKTIMSGSIDGKMAVFRQSNSEGGRKGWAKNSHRRVHNGEVKAMAAFDSKVMSVVVSGGIDVAPMVTPLRENGKENPRALPSLPQESPVVSAPKARLLASWWDQDISIWKIAKQPQVDAASEPQKPRKLVSKIALDSKHPIQSVSISADGKLLVASTISEIKLFQLRKKSDSDNLSVRKIEVSRGFATLGARSVNFSPDAKWIAAVTPENEIHVARVAADSEKPKHLTLLAKTTELERHDKNMPYQSGFKDYERTITRVAFASDSSVLVVGDLSGYLDSWVLEGNEDLTAPAVDVAKHDSDAGSSAAGSDSDSDDSDDDDTTIVFYGQHWTDNPSGHLLPKLDSAPLVLSFRPQKNTSEVQTGNPGVHATRHNPHAHSHELPEGHHKLWIMTARHQMYELDVLAGRLSDWSRRNPSSVLPEAIKVVKDRIMGAVWDISATRERLWIYGSSWMVMLNMAGDLATTSDSQALKKRKRKGANAPESTADDNASPTKKAKSESGAGSKVDPRRRTGVADVAKRLEDGEAKDLDLTNGKYGDEDEEMDDDDEEGVQLTRLRSNGEEQDGAQSKEEGNDTVKRWWCSFKYRPILGMVALEDEEHNDASEDKALEVAVVERPLWEAWEGRRV